MIKKLKLGLLIAVLSLVVGISSVNAADLTWSNDTTVTIGADNYTIYGGSAATSMVVNATTLVVTVPALSTFTLASSSRFVLNNNASITPGCTFALSNLTVNGSVTAGAVTITPDTATTCTVAGGGGGGAPADTTPPTGTSVSINAGAVTASSVSATLTLAATDATQMLISNDAGFAGAVWESYAVSKAWTLVLGDGVKTVYAKFRDAALNMSVATSDTITVSGTGTIAVVSNEPTQGCSGGNQYNTSTGALCMSSVAQAAIAGCGNRTSGFSTATGGSCVGNIVSAAAASSYNFGIKTLKNGSKGDEVKELQRFLNQVLSLGLVVDGKLGPKTIAVIKKWQKANGLVADGLVGPKTKAKMNLSVQ
ncbi:MAG: peptidoglycan-binding domain-containing protein [Candidatus Paceibacterota bacterium]